MTKGEKKGRKSFECGCRLVELTPATLHYGAFQVALVAKNLPAKARDSGLIPRLGGSPGKDMATRCSILAWRILRKRSLSGYIP